MERLSRAATLDGAAPGNVTKGAEVAERVSLVVATRDRCPDLMRSLPHHTAPVIVVDNGSSDGTPEEVRRRFPAVEVVALADNRGAVARNFGVDVARTPYIAFADDDSWWAPGALERAADLLDLHPELAVVVARVLIGPDQRLDPLSADMAAMPQPALGPGPSVLGFLACAAVVRREAFRQVGGFDDVVFFCGEEERLALDLTAAGWQLAYVDDVVVHHHPSPVRDPHGRQVLSLRNAFLTAVMRRPWRVVAARAIATWQAGPTGREALRAAVPRLRPALQRRELLPPSVEAARARLDQPPTAK